MPDITQTELMDMIAADESPSNISSKIKDLLYAKTAEKVDAARPDVANTMFQDCLLYTSPSPRDRTRSRMPSSA